MLIMDIDHLMLSSFRCDFDDTAQYRVSAMNSKGELSAFASIVVKSRFQQVFSPSHPNAINTNTLRHSFHNHVIIQNRNKPPRNHCVNSLNVVLKVLIVITLKSRNQMIECHVKAYCLMCILNVALVI